MAPGTMTPRLCRSGGGSVAVRCVYRFKRRDVSEDAERGCITLPVGHGAQLCAESSGQIQTKRVSHRHGYRPIFQQ